MPPSSRTPPHALHSPALEHAHKDFAALTEDLTVDEALAEVRRSKVESRIVYFYVVDAAGKLRGVVPVRRLLLSPPEMPVEQIMVKRFVALPDSATLLDACEMFILHRLMALPIIDAEGRIRGVIDVDQYTDEIRELDEREQSEDIFQLIGVRLARLRQASLGKLFRSRFPWLLCNVAGGVACALVAGVFELVLEEVVALALFIPVVLALAESVSIQSLTVAIQMQHGRPAAWSEITRALSREAPLGLLLGLACGGLVGGIAWLWKGEGGVAACILVSIALTVMLAASYGFLIPSLLNKAQRDPRIASGPMVLAITDISTMVVYLGLATAFLR